MTAAASSGRRRAASVIVRFSGRLLAGSDLNDLIVPSSFVLTQAVGINTTGMIVAIERDAGGEAGHPGHDTHEVPVRVFLLLPAGVRP
jgi:hypothetical protein